MRCLLILSPALLTAAAPARELATARFANVFVGSEPVIITAGEGEAADLLLRDIDGREVARLRIEAAGPVDFGPLPPGYYEAVAGETVMPLAVLIDPARRVPGPSRLGVDNAMSWLVPGSQFEPLAALLKQCGLGMVRERLAWGHVESERGAYQWDNQYGASLAALSGQGIRVYDVFHGTPGWSRADGDGHGACDDLRDIYRFARELAGRWRGTVEAWEVWNEPDISFFRDPASEMAAFQKAAYLGFKSVDREVLVLGPSIAHGVCRFSQGLLENDLGPYMDIWNYHVYADPSAYAGRAADWRAHLAEHGVDLPLWVTEAGDRVPGPDGVLSNASRRHQAEFISRAFALGLAAGVDRHYYFVYPFYRESDIGWGLFEPQQRAPFPGLAAMSTATWALGRGDYLGRIADLPDEARAYAFDRGDGTACLVVWREADEPAPVALPLDWAAVSEAANHVGTPIAAGQGPVAPAVARAAVYCITSPRALGAVLTPPEPVAEPQLAPPVTLPAIVVRALPLGAEADKDADAFRIKAEAPVPLALQVYNFGTEPFSGRLRLRVPDGLVASGDRWPIDLPPGAMQAVEATIQVPARMVTSRIVADCVTDGAGSSRAVVNLSLDVNDVPPLAELDLGLDDPARWERNIAGHGVQTNAAGADGGARFEFAFTGEGDPWAYPQARFEPALDASSYDGLRFEYRTSTDDVGTVRVMAVEADGPTFMTSAGLPGSVEWRQVTLPFESLNAYGNLPAGHAPTIDTSALLLLRVGCNCKPAQVTLEVRDLRLVRWVPRG